MNDSTTNITEPRDLSRIGQPETSTPPGDIRFKSVDVVDGLPATPAGLLNIATVFEGQGYTRLGTYLRACADQMAATACVRDSAAPVGDCLRGVVTAVLAGGDRFNRSEVMLTSDRDVFGTVVAGSRVELRVLPAAPATAEV